ncbi:hypothetical protein XF14_29160 [Burkholderia gladioli]|nr:hypothetical protein XF14_29160 [Burkholderia gladioli]
MHAAGVLDDARLVDQDAARLRRVAAPKLDGARHLLDALAGASPAAPLDFVWLFSSITALHGGAGQANYAAANAALDALARRRRAEGRPALSLCLGAVAGEGMAADPRAAVASLGACFEA